MKERVGLLLTLPVKVVGWFFAKVPEKSAVRAQQLAEANFSDFEEWPQFLKSQWAQDQETGLERTERAFQTLQGIDHNYVDRVIVGIYLASELTVESIKILCHPEQNESLAASIQKEAVQLAGDQALKMFQARGKTPTEEQLNSYLAAAEATAKEINRVYPQNRNSDNLLLRLTVPGPLYRMILIRTDI